MKYSFIILATLWFNCIALAQVNPPAIKIGNQTWMKKNLNLTTYRNGDPIPEVKDSIEWANSTTGAWCHYNNDPANDAIYGKLYNWYAVNDPRGLAPLGWHIASDEEWIMLTAYLGGNDKAGTKLKEAGTKHWTSTEGISTNSSGFTGLPGGSRVEDGTFDEMGETAYWWTSTESETNGAWYRYILGWDGAVHREAPYKQDGFSIRCMKDNPTQSIVSNIAKTKINIANVQIGNQTWMKRDLNVSKYRNGDLIPEVKDSTAWSKLTTGAWCHYNNDPANDAIYGKLYNWYAVNDPRGLVPNGWHIPSDAEWNLLIKNIDPAADTTCSNCVQSTTAGGAMKETGIIHWSNPNTGATNRSGFTGLPGGYRYYDGTFHSGRNFGNWWSSTENDATSAWLRTLPYAFGNVARNYSNKHVGLSVRCLNDTKPQGIVAINTQTNPETIIIGKQTWMVKNLNISKFRNGDTIPEVKTHEELFNAGLENKPAWCYYDNDPANGLKYGKLYNWAAVNDPRGLAPQGWHVPGIEEWDILVNYLGGKDSAGIKMKSMTGWKDDNGKTGNGNNVSGFRGLPGGDREGSQFGDFNGINNNGMWWSSSGDSQFYAWRIALYYHSSAVSMYNDKKEKGLSVRCVKD